ncbi:MAG: hypothetical protein GY923_17025, partial [Aestuariibacter sp.]|nr:hypothetical protein [Aestuariibacter sp.]MCP4949200.1 hypothetical protein [Aestuariibacter sp.]
MKRWIKQVMSLVAVVFPAAAQAVTCQSVFPDPAASHSASGYIQFQPQSRLIGSDGTLDVASMLDNSGGTSCDSV